MYETVRQEIPAAVAGIELWLESVRAQGGYGGPAIGFHHACMAYCGPGLDWRYEGILDGRCMMFKRTADPAYVNLIARDLNDICAGRLTNGTFRSSWFENNPFEGGMPHEPAMLAAACRAWRIVKEFDAAPPKILSSIQIFLDRYLFPELWNKRLHTFNDWPISEFQWYSPSSAAACAELLLDYGELMENASGFEPYIIGAVESIMRLQVPDGPQAGGIPTSSRPNEPVSPFLAARCLPALAKASKAFSRQDFADAAKKLLDFLSRNHMRRVVSTEPLRGDDDVLVGAVAGTCAAVQRAGSIDKLDIAPALELVMRNRHASGAVGTAENQSRKVPDWRHVMPCSGWVDKVYAFLAALHGAEKAPEPELCPDMIPCRTNGFQTQFIEDSQTIRIERRGKCVYKWSKGARWAESLISL